MTGTPAAASFSVRYSILPDTVMQVIFIHHFWRNPMAMASRSRPANPHRLGTLRDDKQVSALLGKRLISQGKEPADISECIFLCTHRTSVGVSKHLFYYIRDTPVCITRFTLFNEPGIFGEAAGIYEKRGIPCNWQMRLASRIFSILTGWPPPGVVTVMIHKGILDAPFQ